MGNDHVFCPVGDGVYLIKCTRTGGGFAVDIWKTEKIPKNYCPCCGCDISQEIKK